MKEFAVMAYLAACLSVISFQNSSQAGSTPIMMPAQFTIEACQFRLSIDGRVIANMKWTGGKTREQAHQAFITGDSPQWHIEQVRRWIDSAYDWPGHPIDWFNREWNLCEKGGAA